MSLISRVAESCFWMTRYMERAEATSRMVAVHRQWALDSVLEEHQLDVWLPLIVVVGERERFLEIYDGETPTPEQAQDYLVWDERNPVSVMSSIRWLRANARTIREVISLEMWNCTNEFWNWIPADEARDIYEDDPDEFHGRVTSFAMEMRGWTLNSMMREMPLAFMSLGRPLERASQTARLIDIKHHLIGFVGPDEQETPQGTAEWLALLRSYAAQEPFLKTRSASPDGRRVAQFLMLEPEFPRSNRYCLSEARSVLTEIQSKIPPDMGGDALARLSPLEERYRESTLSEIEQRGLHPELTSVVDGVAEICGLIDRDFFSYDPGTMSGENSLSGAQTLDSDDTDDASESTRNE